MKRDIHTSSGVIFVFVLFLGVVSLERGCWETGSVKTAWRNQVSERCLGASLRCVVFWAS